MLSKDLNEHSLTYEIRIFNHSADFICLPVSTTFSNTGIRDTVELAIRQKNDDNINYVGLTLSSEDVKSGFNYIPLFPIVIGPKVTAVFFVKLELPSTKKGVFFELDYCNQKDLNFCELIKQYNIDKRCTNGLTFKTKRLELPLQ